MNNQPVPTSTYIEYIPDLVILDVGNTLPRLRESMYRAYEHIPDGPTEGMVEDEISNMIEKIFQCIDMRDSAPQNLTDMLEEQCSHDMEFDQGEYRIAQRMYDFGRDVIKQCHGFGMYFGGEYLPFFFKEQLGDDAIILQRIGYAGDDE